MAISPQCTNDRPSHIIKSGISLAVIIIVSSSLAGCRKGTSVSPNMQIEYSVCDQEDLDYLIMTMSSHARENGLTFADKSQVFQKLDSTSARTHHVIYMGLYRDGLDEIVATNTFQRTDRPLIVFFPGMDSQRSAASRDRFIEKLNKNTVKRARKTCD